MVQNLDGIERSGDSLACACTGALKRFVQLDDRAACEHLDYEQPAASGILLGGLLQGIERGQLVYELVEPLVEVGPACGERIYEGMSARATEYEAIWGGSLRVQNSEPRRQASLYSAAAFACNASGLRSMLRKWSSNTNFWTVRRPRHSAGRGC